MVTIRLWNVIKRVPSTNVSEYPLQRDGGDFTQASVYVICDKKSESNCKLQHPPLNVSLKRKTRVSWGGFCSSV